MTNKTKIFEDLSPARLVGFSLLTLGMVATVRGQTEPVTPNPGGEIAPVWINHSVVETPHINAVRVENRGVIEAVTPDEVPFYFFNTQFFTNSGTIRIEKDFDYRNYKTHLNPSGAVDFDPKRAKVFNNQSGGEIISVTDALTTGKINIEADRVINQGLISVENAGIVTIKGSFVDLRRGALEVKAGRNYDHPAGLNDIGDPLNWGYNNDNLSGSQGPYQARRPIPVFYQGANYVGVIQDWGLRDIFWNLRLPGPALPRTVPFRVFNFGVGGGITFFSDSFNWEEITSPYAFPESGRGSYKPPYGEYEVRSGQAGGLGYTGFFDGYVEPVLIAENWHRTHQAILVKQMGSSDVKFTVKMVPQGWTSGSSAFPEAYYNGVVVEFKTADGLTNSIAGGRDTRSLYLIDEHPNVMYSQNYYNFNSTITASKPTFMPDNFVVTRFKPAEFETDGVTPNGLTGIWDFYRATQRMTSSMPYQDAYYGFRITNIVSRAQLSELPLPNLEDSDGILQPGRIIVEADNLDLRNARIRAEGGLRIKTKNLIGSTNAVIDCQNLSLELGNTSGLLVITNVVPDKVERFTGGVKAYSIVWANEQREVRRDSLNPPPAEPTTDTVTVNLHYHLLVVDAFLNTETPVIVNDLTATSHKVVFKDLLRITEKLRINAEHLSVHRDLILGKETLVGSGEYSLIDGQNRWDKTVAPELKYFTNHALINVPQYAHFGDDRQEPYETWVNYGTNNAQNVNIRAKFVQNMGRINASASINIDAGDAILQEGMIEAGNSISLTAQNLKMRFQTNITGGEFVLNVSGVMTDGGEDSGNIIESRRGVRLVGKSAQGDLLGTEIVTHVDDFEVQEIHWPAENRGATVEGFKDNCAIGRLVLMHGARSKFVFTGLEGQDNAIYIDYLDIPRLMYLDEHDILEGKDVLPMMDIEEGYTVYFAASNIPAEILDGMYGGRLRWVRQYPGYYSSMPLYLVGVDKTIRVNRSFRQSILFDTDDDGTANGFDLTPFGGGLPDITSVSRGENKIQIQWMGFPGSLYRIEFKGNIEQAKWQLLKEYYNNEKIVKQINYTVKLSRNTDRGFYRVVFVE